MRTPIVALLLVGSVLPALAQDAAGLREASARFSSAIGAGNAAVVAGFFTDTAVVLPPGRGPLNGKAEVQRFFNNMTRFVTAVKYTTEDVTPIDATTMREVGGLSMTLAKGQVVAGKYLLVWTRAGGEWKIAVDMWNRSNAGGGGQGGGGARPGSGRAGAGRPMPGGGAGPGGEPMQNGGQVPDGGAPDDR